MATAMNALGYDAAALGNHEYNYGLDTLRAFEDQCDHPLLSANSVDWDTRRADLHALRHEDHRPARRAGHGRHPRPGHSGCGDLGRRERRGQGALPRHRRAGEGHGAPDEGRRRRHRRRLVPLGVDHLVVVRRRAALPRERQPAARRAGARHRRDPRRPRARRGARAQGDQHRHRPGGAAQRAALLGHARHGDGPGPGPRRPRLAGQALGVDAAQRQHRARGRRDRGAGAPGAREGARLRQQRHRQLHRRRCRRRPRATRTPRRWTSSTWSRRRR